MQKTKNYGFNKPERTDFINANDWATMMDQVDTELKNHEMFSRLAGMFVGGKELSAEATVTDGSARFPVVKKVSSNTDEVKIFEKEIPIPQGMYSVMVRIKVSDNSGDANLIKLKTTLNTASGKVLKEVRIKPSAFDARDTYQTFGFCVDQNGTKNDKLFITASLLKFQIQTTVSVDYILVSPTYTAVSSIG